MVKQMVKNKKIEAKGLPSTELRDDAVGVFENGGRDVNERICPSCFGSKAAFVDVCTQCEPTDKSNRNLGYSKGKLVYI